MFDKFVDFQRGINEAISQGNTDPAIINFANKIVEYICVFMWNYILRHFICKINDMTEFISRVFSGQFSDKELGKKSLKFIWNIKKISFKKFMKYVVKNGKKGKWPITGADIRMLLFNQKNDL